MWYDMIWHCDNTAGWSPASKHSYWCCEIGSPGTILTLLLFSRILTLLRRLLLLLRRISMFVQSHSTHSTHCLTYHIRHGQAPMSRSLSAIIMDPTLKPDNVPDWLTERNIKPQDRELMMAAGSRHLSGGEGGALNMINPANTRHRWQKLTSLSSSKWRRPLSPLNKNLMSAVCWPCDDEQWRLP